MDVKICCNAPMQSIERFKEGTVIKQVVRCIFCGWKEIKEVKKDD